MSPHTDFSCPAHSLAASVPTTPTAQPHSPESEVTKDTSKGMSNSPESRATKDTERRHPAMHAQAVAELRDLVRHGFDESSDRVPCALCRESQEIDR